MHPQNRAYFRKVGYAWGECKKGHSLVNLGECEEETPLNSMQI